MYIQCFLSHPALLTAVLKTNKLLLSGLQICLRPHGWCPRATMLQKTTSRTQTVDVHRGVIFLIPLLDAPLDKALRAGFVPPVEAEVLDPTSHAKGCRLWGSWMGSACLFETTCFWLLSLWFQSWKASTILDFSKRVAQDWETSWLWAILNF